MDSPQSYRTDYRHVYSSRRSSVKDIAFVKFGRLAVAALPALHAISASAAIDITALITANGGNNNVALNGADYVVNLPVGSTTSYNGVLSGTGTLAINSPDGATTLILTQTPTYTLPPASITQTTSFTYVNYVATTYDGLTSPNGFHGGVTVINNPDPASLTIGTGTTLQLGNAVANNVALNNDVLDNGTLELDEGSSSNEGPVITLSGLISGSGDLVVISPGFNGGVRLDGENTYSGASFFLEDGANVGSAHMYGSTPNTKFIFITTSYLPTTPVAVLGLPGVVDVTQDIWEDRYENDINLDTYTGLVTFRGVYSYSDSGDKSNPSLTNTQLNYTYLNGNASERGVNIEGSVVQFGDGTTSTIFISGNASNTYINLHNNGILGFHYDGVVTLNTTIGGGSYLGSFSTPGVGDVVITGNASNANRVVLTQPELYNGVTQIDAGTILQLGDGAQGDASGPPGKIGFFQSSGGNGSLLTADSNYTLSEPTDNGVMLVTYTGAATDSIVDIGQLVVDNVVGAYDNIGTTQNQLSNISGSGALTQIGSLPLTLSGTNTYSGATTVSAGVLQLEGSIAGDTLVAAGGVLSGTGTLAAADIEGILAPGDSTLATGQLNAAGAITFGLDSLLRIQGDGSGNASHVAGQNNIELDGTLFIRFSAKPVVKTYALLTTTLGAITGAFAHVQSPNAFGSVVYHVQEVDFVLTSDDRIFADGFQTP